MLLGYSLSYSTCNGSLTLENILSKSNPAEWHVQLHKLGIGTTFANPRELSLDEIVEAVRKLNPNNEKILEYADSLKKFVLSIKEMGKSRLIESDKNISEWAKKDIREWSKEAKR